MILGEHEATRFGPKMTFDARRQGRHHDPPARRSPTCPSEVGYVRADDQILDEETGMAFETRAERWRDLKLSLLMDRQLRARGAVSTALARRVRRSRLARLFHAARLDVRLDVRPSRATLQPCDLVAKRSNRSLKLRPLFQ
jgi:hypothetical protein